MQPRISIITPVFNRENVIQETIESVQKQTFTDYEHIIIDDGSTDSSKDIIIKYAANDSRIKPVFLAENSGGYVGKVRNAAIKQAKGELIAFIDSDDLWMENKLELQIRQIERNDTDITYHPIYRFEGDISNVNNIYGKTLRKDYFFPELFENGGYPPITSILMKKSIFDEVGYFDETMRLSEDHDLILRISMNNFRFDYISEPLGYFRRGHESLVNSNSLQGKDKARAESYRAYLYSKKKLLEEKKLNVNKLSKTNLFYGYIYYYFKLLQNPSVDTQEKVKIRDTVIESIKKYNLFEYLATEFEILRNIRNP